MTTEQPTAPTVTVEHYDSTHHEVHVHLAEDLVLTGPPYYDGPLADAEAERVRTALAPLDAGYLSEVERNAVALAAENERLRTATRQVAELADEWDRFGLKGPAQRLRHILGGAR
jgi:hypothetical protein